MCLRNHETDSKRCGTHARAVCGAVILPQRYTKNREEDLEHVHEPRALYTNSIQEKENEHGKIHLLICVNVNKKTIVQCFFMLWLLLRDVAVSD